MDEIPDAFAFRVYFARAVLSGASAGTVAEPLGAALAACEGGGREEAFPAVLAFEERDFDYILANAQEAGILSFAGGELFTLGGDKTNFHTISSYE